MNSIHRVVKQASWRLMLIDWLRVFAVVLTVALGLAIVARLVEKTFALGEYFGPWWLKGGIGAGVLVLLITTVVALIRKPRAIAAARQLDERAGLREALSTALYIKNEQDPWSKNVIDDAQRTAASVQVGRAIPVEAPKLWPVPVCTAFAMLLVWITVPDLDLLGIKADQVAKKQQETEIKAVKADVAEKAQKLKEMLDKAKVEVKDEQGDAEAGKEQKPEMNDPEAIRRAAVKKLTDVSEKLEAMKEGDKAAQVEAVKEAMKQLKQPGDGPLNDFARSLSRGDFNKAQEQLNQLTQELASGNNMSPEQKEQAKQQLDNLAKQMDKLADQQKQLEEKLKQQGLDKNTAQDLAKKASSGNPEDLKKALEQMQNLSAEQKQQMMEMAKSTMEASKQCEGMSEGLSKMAKGMSQQGLQQDGMEGAQQVGQELSAAEMLSEDMQQLDAALSEAKAQLAELGECLGGTQDGDGSGQGKVGRWREGSGRQQGMGSGGPGQGNGPSPDAEAVDYKSEKKKGDTKTTQGPIIGTRLVYGEQVKGESVAEFSDVVASASAEAAEAIDSQQVPRELHDAVKHYFGTLQEKVKKEKPAEPAKPASTPAAPAATTPEKK